MTVPRIWITDVKNIVAGNYAVVYTVRFYYSSILFMIFVANSIAIESNGDKCCQLCLVSIYKQLQQYQ